MLKAFQNYFKNRERQRLFQAFYTETKSNLEQYYVMFQLNRLRFFPLSEWEKIKSSPGVKGDEAIREYARRLVSYNQILKEYKDFEQWYNEDLERKNQDNGRILHQKKELSIEQFKGLEDVIKVAVAHVEQLFTTRE